MKGFFYEAELNRKLKAEKAKEAIRRKTNNIAWWFKRNREMVLTLGPICITGAATITKVVLKNVNLRREKKLKDCYCYDRSLGHYWALRRELTNREWVEIDQRKMNGERLADILSELKVLK